MSDLRGAPVIDLHSSPVTRPLAERDDDSLMMLAAGDHRPAFEVLVRRHLPRLTNYCAKFLGDGRTGEEISQEVLLTVWARRRLFHTAGGFRFFLFGVARNRCISQMRSDKRRRRWDLGPARPPTERLSSPGAAESADQLDALLEQERVHLVRRALLRLPPKLREAVLLRFDQGLPYEDIARIVRRPQSTVRSRVFLAMKMLREQVAGGSDS